jgi:hypothetical protein
MPIDYPHHSPSSLNLFAAAPAMWVLERIMKIPQSVGVPAHRGTAVESGVTHGLLDLRAPMQDCIDIAMTRYDMLTAMTPDPRRQKYRDTIPDMVRSALKELRSYGKPSTVQGFVQWRPEGLGKPIIGYFDFEWAKHGILGDLKTTERMPSEIKRSHARQVALYATSDNIDARLIYVTPRKLEAYKLENIREHRQALLNIAMRVEKLLALSDEPEYFLSITVPDLESFYWNNPAARQLAFEHWGV